MLPVAMCKATPLAHRAKTGYKIFSLGCALVNAVVLGLRLVVQVV